MNTPCLRMDHGGRTAIVLKSSQGGGADVEWWVIPMQDGPLDVFALDTKALLVLFPLDPYSPVAKPAYIKAQFVSAVQQYLLKMSYSGGTPAAYQALCALGEPDKVVKKRIEERLAI